MLLASGSLEFGALNVIGPLFYTAYSSQYVIAMTGTYSKLTRALTAGKKFLVYVTNLFFDF